MERSFAREATVAPRHTRNACRILPLPRCGIRRNRHASRRTSRVSGERSSCPHDDLRRTARRRSFTAFRTAGPLAEIDAESATPSRATRNDNIAPTRIDTRDAPVRRADVRGRRVTGLASFARRRIDLFSSLVSPSSLAIHFLPPFLPPLFRTPFRIPFCAPFRHPFRDPHRRAFARLHRKLVTRRPRRSPVANRPRRARRLECAALDAPLCPY
ncbi:hypothetical protein [Burkholderia thailandensis]|uniref:hypothetical protein n=1 Tax=Burkholderia thailandensis TaxID=57975 RepID=UPI0013784C8D|nr:hypothetical protein [Burkholderia thailandensis]NBD05074.1 hypothetical protein [Burkholderia thailandensis]